MKKLLFPFLAILLLSSCGKESIVEKDSASSNTEETVISDATAEPEISISTEPPEPIYKTNLSYANQSGKITNTYKTGGTNALSFVNVNSGRDYDGSAANVFDIYIPSEALGRKDKSVGIVLYLHGGFFVKGDKDDIKNDMLSFSASNPYITASMNYTLLPSSISSATKEKDKSVYRILDEINAAITAIKNYLVSLGFDQSKLSVALQGEDAGAHLAMLYSNTRQNDSSIPLKFVVNKSGLVKVDKECFVYYKDVSLRGEGIDSADIAYQKQIDNLQYVTNGNVEVNDYYFLNIINVACGSPYSTLKMASAVNVDLSGKTDSDVYKSLVNDYGKSISPVDTLTTFSLPIISAYGGLDNKIGINHYATLHPALIEKNITNSFVYYADSNNNLDNCQENDLQLLQEIKDYSATSFGY